MSDATPTPADVAAKIAPTEPAQAESTPAQESTSWDDIFAGETPEKVREALDNSRKWEQRAKENKAAADELAAIKASQQTEEERTAERLATAEKRAAEAEARALRREIALDPLGDGKHVLPPKDAALLDAITDEDAMRAFAARLATPAVQNGNTAPLEGNPPQQSLVDERHAWAQALVDRAR